MARDRRGDPLEATATAGADALGVLARAARAPDVTLSPADRRARALIRQQLFGMPAAPVKIGRFTVLEQIGSGGMGVVYAALDEELGRRVAIKLLRSDDDDEARARFVREARTAAQLAHPNVVTILEVGSHEGQVFLAMEHLEGEDLADLLARDGPLGFAQARAITLQVCSALAAMHDRGIVHRDIKPHNCFLTRTPGEALHVKVLDFGIAKVIRDGEPSALSTTGGKLVGTAAYIAPEQALAAPLDGRADVYAIGVLLYEMLTGAPPFTGSNFMAVVSRHLSEVPAPPRSVAPGAQIPAACERAVLRCLAKRPDDRFASVAELAAALAAIDPAGSRRPAPTWPRGLVVALAGLAASAALLIGSFGAPVDGDAQRPREDPSATGTPTNPADRPIVADPGDLGDPGARARPPGPAPPELASTRSDPPVGVTPEAVERSADAALSLTPQATDATAADSRPVDRPAGEEPAGEKPAGEEPAGEEPAGEESADEKAAPRARRRELPPQLAARTLERVLSRRAGAVQQWGREHGGLPGTTVEIALEIGARGVVDRVRVRDPLMSPPLRRCLEGVMLRTRFPQARGDSRAEHEYSM